MAQTTDLYPILKAYANKNNSPYINIEEFIAFLENWAKRKAPEHPEWIRWTGETGVKFWSEMGNLVESGRCSLLTDTSEGRIYMPHLYVDLLKEAYHSIDDTANLPFPGEESLRITIPGDQVTVLQVETALAPFFEDRRDASGMPVSLKNPEAPENTAAPENAGTLPAIIKLIFPDSYGSALTLAPLIPRRLMESALLKIRYYLKTHGNREYALHKLSPQLQGRETYIREILDQIAIRPLDCLTAMESYNDFAWLFWGHFCSLVKNDFKKKKEILTEDLAAIQAIFIIEICSSCYKARAVKQRERELAFRALELRLEKPPFYYTLDEISKFTNEKEQSLISIYTPEELDSYIKKRITESGGDALPEWMVLQGKKGERWYIKKEKYLPLCAGLIAQTRPLIRKEISKRWTKLIRSFQSEAAMETDEDFNRLLKSYTAFLNPVLMALLDDQKLLFVYEELERTQGIIPPSSRIFKGGSLIPMNALYGIRRKELVGDARLILPFWYSIPILAAIIAFFKKLGNKRRAKKQTEEEIVLEEELEEGGKEKSDIPAIARDIADQLVPPGQSLDDYLGELESRWSRLLDKKARQNLIEDVNALVRDNLRQTIRVHKKQKISREGLAEIAAALIAHTPALRGLGAQDSLHLYLELYMVKLLLTFKM
jgi:hypothetical protein